MADFLECTEQEEQQQDDEIPSTSIFIMQENELSVTKSKDHVSYDLIVVFVIILY